MKFIVPCTALISGFFIITFIYNLYMERNSLYNDIKQYVLTKSNEFNFFPNGNRSFSSKYIPLLNKLDLINPRRCTNESNIFEQNVTFISAWSNNHHGEAYNLAASLRDFKGLKAGQKKLIVYNLGGLNDSEVQDYLLTFGCMVEFRQFDFSQYPAYVRNLKEYRWKPLIIALALLEFPAIWWLDASMTFNNNEKLSLQSVYDAIKQNPNHTSFGITDQTSHSISAATDPGMYHFLPIDLEKAKHQTMADASHMLWYSTNKTKKELLKWFVWCALEEECMTPKGAKLSCEFQGDRYLYYAKCNRYDQSAISIIATVMTNFHVNNYLLNKTVSPLETRRVAP